jgi:hypothetical protein
LESEVVAAGFLVEQSGGVVTAGQFDYSDLARRCRNGICWLGERRGSPCAGIHEAVPDGHRIPECNGLYELVTIAADFSDLLDGKIKIISINDPPRLGGVRSHLRHVKGKGTAGVGIGIGAGSEVFQGTIDCAIL